MRLIRRGVVGGRFMLAFSACAAQTDPASNIGALTATLNAHGHTDGTPAHYFFQYSTRAADLDTQPGRRTPTRTIPPHVPPNGGNVPFGESVGGLTPGTTYYYRVCGSDQQYTPTVCARTLQFTTASTPTFTPHPFAASSSLKDITSIGTRLYAAGDPCPDAEPPPASQCSFVGSLAPDGTKKQVDAPDGPVAAITRGPDGDPWLLTAGNIDIGPGGALTHFGLNLETLPGSVSFGRSPPSAVTAADGALWVIQNRGATGVSAWRTDGSPILGLGYGPERHRPGHFGGDSDHHGPGWGTLGYHLQHHLAAHDRRPERDRVPVGVGHRPACDHRRAGRGALVHRAGQDRPPQHWLGTSATSQSPANRTPPRTTSPPGPTARSGSRRARPRSWGGSPPTDTSPSTRSPPCPTVPPARSPLGPTRHCGSPTTRVGAPTSSAPADRIPPDRYPGVEG